MKSAPIPETQENGVKTLVGLSFNKEVMESEKEWLVKFYAPWCGHCKTIAPLFEAAAKLLAGNPNIELGEFDSTKNEVEGVSIKGYPTIYFYKKDKTLDPLTLDGGRTTEDIVSWLKDHTEYDWVEVPEEPAEEETEAGAEEL